METAPFAPAARSAAPTAESHPRWVRWVTHLAVLPPVLSGIWRIAMSLNIPVGWDNNHPHFAWWAPLYAVTLSAFAESCALLTLGFIKPWGVVAPGWIPFLGGRRVHPAAAIGPASLAAILLTSMGAVGVGKWHHNMSYAYSPHGGYGVLMTVAYAPLVAWGPLLAVATFGYWLRTRRLTRSSH